MPKRNHPVKRKRYSNNVSPKTNNSSEACKRIVFAPFIERDMETVYNEFLERLDKFKKIKRNIEKEYFLNLQRVFRGDKDLLKRELDY